MFLKLIFFGLTSYGIFTYCMKREYRPKLYSSSDEKTSSEFPLSPKEPSNASDYEVNKESKEPFFESQLSKELKHTPTTSVITPRSSKDKHHIGGVPMVTSEDSEINEAIASSIMNSHNTTNTITKTIVVKTKIKCGDCFPKDCSIM